MIMYNQYNSIASDQLNVCIFPGGSGVLENTSVESDSRDKSDLNEIADQ